MGGWVGGGLVGGWLVWNGLVGLGWAGLGWLVGWPQPIPNQPKKSTLNQHRAAPAQAAAEYDA